MTSLETEYFLEFPNEKIIKSYIKADRVHKTVKASGLPGTRQPVYIVTRRKLAKGFSVLHKSGRQIGNKAEAGGLAPTPIGNLAIKGGVAKHKERELQTGWNASDELIFIYQLMKINIKGWRSLKVEYDEFRHELVILSNNNKDGDKEEEDDNINIEVDIGAATAIDLAKVTDKDVVTKVEVGEGKGKLLLISTRD